MPSRDDSTQRGAYPFGDSIFVSGVYGNNLEAPIRVPESVGSVTNAGSSSDKKNSPTAKDPEFTRN